MPWLSDYLFQSPLKAFCADTPDLLFQFTDYLCYTLPHPRYDYYLSNDFLKTQTRIGKQIEEVTNALGFYELMVKNTLLAQMEEF
jgi:hypothetical protein